MSSRGPDARPAKVQSEPDRACSTRSGAVFDAPAGDLESLLGDLVVSELIPRLMLAHTGARPSGPISFRRVDAFARMAVFDDVDALLDFVDELKSEGLGRSAIFADLLGPAAQHLGRLWERDECTFVDVTIGLGRLHQVFHRLGDAAGQELARGAPEALFALAPGEQHTFGIVMAEEIFRRSGWSTSFDPDAEIGEVVARVASHSYDLFAVSLSCERHAAAAGALIEAVRRRSQNPAIRIMIGGALLASRKDLVQSLQPDLVASDVKTVERLADILKERKAENV